MVISVMSPLEIIGAQSGNHLGEDDIVRFDDILGRTLATATDAKLSAI
jgi:hypothetical protein